MKVEYSRTIEEVTVVFNREKFMFDVTIETTFIISEELVNKAWRTLQMDFTYN
jgi:hypothetical protein